MKKLYYIIAALALIALAACNKAEMPGFLSDPDAVRIEAAVGALTKSNPLGSTIEEQMKFNEGDRISVTNSGKTVVYKLNGGTWAPENAGEYLKWDKNDLTFIAQYPVGYTTLPTDQSTKENLAAADRMYVNHTCSYIPIDRILSTSLQRKNVLVKVKIAGYLDQYKEGETYINYLTIGCNPQDYSNMVDSPLVLDKNGKPLEQYYNKGTVGNTYTAIVSPNKKDENSDKYFIYMNVKGYGTQDSSGDVLWVKGVPELLAGHAYTFNLYVGKNTVKVGSVTVNEWTDSGSLTGGGEAEVDPNADVWDGKTVTAFSTGDSTNPLGDSESAPILIESAAQLAYLAQQVKAGESYSGKYFKLTKDLALAEMPWTPIGGYEQTDESNWEERLFEGNFDGGNHTIYGLKVVAEKKGNDNLQPLGLFGLVNRSSYSSTKVKTYIKNLRISGANVLNENQKSGILCGVAYFVDISGVEVSGVVTARGVCGGLVGAIANSTISNCKAKVKVTSTGSAGGICAESADLELSKCSVSSSEIVGTYQTGGLLGMIYNKLDVTDCTVDASVKGYSVGGLFGVFGVDKQGYARSAKNCTMTGAVTVAKGNGDEYGGGIAGWLYGSCSFENCGFNGTIVKEEGVDANKERVGAAIGKDNVGTCTFTDCWYNADKISDLYKIGGGKDNADYSGITAKNLGK